MKAANFLLSLLSIANTGTAMKFRSKAEKVALDQNEPQRDWHNRDMQLPIEPLNTEQEENPEVNQKLATRGLCGANLIDAVKKCSSSNSRRREVENAARQQIQEIRSSLRGLADSLMDEGTSAPRQDQENIRSSSNSSPRRAPSNPRRTLSNDPRQGLENIRSTTNPSSRGVASNPTARSAAPQRPPALLRSNTGGSRSDWGDSGSRTPPEALDIITGEKLHYPEDN